MPKDNKNIQYKDFEIKESKVDIQKRTFQAIISNQSVDLDNEVVLAIGMNLKRFKEIGVILFNHNTDFVLGSPFEVKRVKDGIFMKANFADEGTSENIDVIYNLVKQGHLKTMSIGFMITEPPRSPTKQDIQTFGKNVRRVIQKSLLLEASIVSVPSNSEAIILACKDYNVDPDDVKNILGDDYKEQTIEEQIDEEIKNTEVEIKEEVKDKIVKIVKTNKKVNIKEVMKYFFEEVDKQNKKSKGILY